MPSDRFRNKPTAAPAYFPYAHRSLDRVMFRPKLAGKMRYNDAVPDRSWYDRARNLIRRAVADGYQPSKLRVRVCDLASVIKELDPLIEDHRELKLLGVPIFESRRTERGTMELEARKYI